MSKVHIIFSRAEIEWSRYARKHSFKHILQMHRKGEVISPVREIFYGIALFLTATDNHNLCGFFAFVLLFVSFSIAICKMWVYNKDNISKSIVFKGEEYEKTKFLVSNRSVGIFVFDDGLQKAGSARRAT